MKKLLNSAKELQDFSERLDILALNQVGKVEAVVKRYNPVVTFDGVTKNTDYRPKPRHQLVMPNTKL
jgi:hypothetical protein